jgi:hypothetical protein
MALKLATLPLRAIGQSEAAEGRQEELAHDGHTTSSSFGAWLSREAVAEPKGMQVLPLFLICGGEETCSLELMMGDGVFHPAQVIPDTLLGLYDFCRQG